MSGRTWILFGIVGALQVVTAAAVLALLWSLYGSGQLAADRGAKAVTLAEVATENRDEVTRLGGTPIGPEPGEVLQGDPGQNGRDGQDGVGSPGPSGAPGRDGRDATPAQIAAAVAAYLKAHPPKAGADGRSGRDGRDGQSPACLAEVDECRGATGAQGPAGADGAPGQPPSAWLWTDPATGTSFECRRVESPDNAPAYACAAVT